MTATMDPTRSATPSVEQRAARLSRASVRRVIEPDTDLPWGTLGSGQLVADELLTVAGLDLDLTADQRARLSREELASMVTTGLRFEAGLIAGFAVQLGTADIADPRVTYMLHEMGEETRHSRAFARLVAELGSQARNPLERGAPARLRKRISRIAMDSPALLTVFVLAGEEIPDLLQKIAAEHPDTDPLVAAVNRYHRGEEARHLAFARMTLAEHWSRAGRLERWRVRHLAPRCIGALFASLVHPGVYRSVGLPGFRTWRSAQRTPERVAVRHEGSRAVLGALFDAGVLEAGRVPRGWRSLCGVDRSGNPVGADVPLPA
jgi:P-aminobenzoate N-oxygenase AurF